MVAAALIREVKARLGRVATWSACGAAPHGARGLNTTKPASAGNTTMHGILLIGPVGRPHLCSKARDDASGRPQDGQSPEIRVRDCAQAPAGMNGGGRIAREGGGVFLETYEGSGPRPSLRG
jgi:hypothetical protein